LPTQRQRSGVDDGPLLAWLKYGHQIDTLVPLPADREIHRGLEGLAQADIWQHEASAGCAANTTANWGQPRW